MQDLGQRNFKKQTKININNHMHSILKIESLPSCIQRITSKSQLAEYSSKQKKIPAKKHCRIKTTQIPSLQNSKTVTLRDNFIVLPKNKYKNQNPVKSEEKKALNESKKIIKLNHRHNQSKGCLKTEYYDEKYSRMEKTASLKNMNSTIKNLASTQNINASRNLVRKNKQKNVQSMHNLYQNQQSKYDSKKRYVDIHPNFDRDLKKKQKTNIFLNNPEASFEGQTTMEKRFAETIKRIKQKNEKQKIEQAKKYEKREKKLLKKINEMQQRNVKMNIFLNQAKKKGFNIDQMWVQIFK